MEKSKINFNNLAWNAPNLGNDRYGYLPSHELYQTICAWLKTGTKRYTVKGKNSIICRIANCEGTGGKYDVSVEMNRQDKAICWYFIEPGTYECFDKWTA